MSGPYVSVLLPTHQRAQLCVNAIRSVLAQDFGDFEILVCDDSPDDLTEKAVASFADARVHYFRPEINGLVPKLNELLRRGRGTWAVMLGDDDLFEPGYLRAMVETVKAHAEASIVRTRYCLMHDDGTPFALAKAEPRCYEPAEFLLAVFEPWYEHMVNGTGVFFRREKLIELGGFLETGYGNGWNTDTEAWAKLGLQGRAYFDSRPLVKLRVSKHSGYKKPPTDFQPYVDAKRRFYASVCKLLDDGQNPSTPWPAQTLQRARYLIDYHWMREEAQIVVEPSLLALLARRRWSVRDEVRALLKPLYASGLPLLTPKLHYLARLGDLPLPLRAALLRQFLLSWRVFRSTLPLRRWMFLDRRPRRPWQLRGHHPETLREFERWLHEHQAGRTLEHPATAPVAATQS